MAQLPGDFLIYNGVKLQIVKTDEINQRAIMSSDGIDYLYTHIRAAFQCVYNYGIDGALPPDTNAVLLPLLQAPRGQLIFGFSFLDQSSFNVVSNVVVSPPNGVLVDLNNGPIPEDVVIHRIDGAQTFHIRFVINTWVRLDNCFSTTAVLSNRYSQSISIDKDFYSIVRSSGTTYFNSSFLANANISADNFRRYLFPPIPYNFKREGIEMEVDSKKNVARWTVTDVEQAKNIGETNTNGSGLFITRVEGSYHIETMPTGTNNQNVGPIPGGNFLSVVGIDVYGSRFASSWVLIQYAIGLATSLVPLGIPANQGGGIVRSMSITKDIIKNAISLKLAFITFAVNNGPIGMPSDALKVDNIFTQFSPDDGTNPSPPTDFGTRGTANLLALEAALKTTCAPIPNDVYCVGDLSGGVYSGCPSLVQVTQFNFIPSITTVVIKLGNPYTKYWTKKKTKVPTGIKPLPVAPYSRPGLNLNQDNPQPPAQIVQPAQPQAERVIEGGGERIGKPPDIPIPPFAIDPGVDLNWKPAIPHPVPENGIFNIPEGFQFQGANNSSPGDTTSGGGSSVASADQGEWYTKSFEITMFNVELMPDMQTLLYSAEWRIEQVAILKPGQDPGLLAFPMPPWINYPLGGTDNNGNQIGYTIDDLNNNGGGIVS